MIGPSVDTHSQFIELCLLLGCDYLEPIKGIGPKSAYKLMKEHGSLKVVLEHLQEKYAMTSNNWLRQLTTWFHVSILHRVSAKESKDDGAEDGKKKRGGIVIPEEWPWEEAKKIFEKPDVTPADQLEVRLLLPPS